MSIFDDRHAMHEMCMQQAAYETYQREMKRKKAEEQYHKSKEYRDLRAKKRANKKLRKKSQGR